MNEAIIFIGIQASGKSTFYREQLSDSHIRINLDMLKTRNRERILVEACLEAKQSFVIDNTNPTIIERKRYFDILSGSDFRAIGYYFSSKISDALHRNNNRKGAVPDVAVKSTHKKLEIPSYEEGFDELRYVTIENEDFTVQDWQDEI